MLNETSALAHPPFCLSRTLVLMKDTRDLFASCAAVVTFEEICKTPVKLSMLVVALRSGDGEKADVPRDLRTIL